MGDVTVTEEAAKDLKCPRCDNKDLIEERKLSNNVVAGAAAGAVAGSVFPGLGTVAGALVGTATAYFASDEIRPRYKCGNCDYTWGNNS